MHILLFGLFLSCFPLQIASQTDPEFPLVRVPDVPASISTTVDKSYVTTISLEPTSSLSVFKTETFIAAAQPWYSSGAGLAGFISIPANEVIPNQMGTDLLLVTYTVRYNLEVMSQSATDALVEQQLGNYDLIRSNVGAPENDLSSFYTFSSSDQNFRFAGNPLCGNAEVSCNSSQYQCTENLNGISITCESPCKQGYCLNGGSCSHASLDEQPSCFCLSSSGTWFVGDQCQTLIALWFIIVIIVACVILIILAIVLACRIYSYRKKKLLKKEPFKTTSNIRTGFGPGPTNSHNSHTNKAYLTNEERIERNNIPQQTSAPRPRLEARPDPVVLRSVPSDTSTRRRSWSSDDARRRNDRRYGSRSPSSDSFDSESQSEGNPDEQESSAESTATFESQGSKSNPGTFTTASHEFGSGGNVDLISKKDQGTSPIRWLPSTRTPQPMGNKLGKIDISERKGWLPSLGPQMFDLDMAKDENQPSTSNQTSGLYVLPAETDI